VTLSYLRSRVNSAKELAKRDGVAAVTALVLQKLLGRGSILFHRLFHEPRRGKSLKIAFYPTGGFGDYIISAKILEELLEISDCRITVFCEKQESGLAVYGNRERVRVENHDRFELTRYGYDIAFTIDHFVRINNIDWKRVKSLDPELYKRCRHLSDGGLRGLTGIDKQCFRETVRFRQCEVQKLNRWTELRMGGVFEIREQRIHIPLSREGFDLYKSLNIDNKAYITFNCGADAMRKTGTQTKVWDREYYGALARLIKEDHPEIKLLQLGSADSKRIGHMDEYFLGMDLELVKWIIKGSALHIDCEGGLVHLAVQLDTKCAVLFGPTPMHMYAYPQNINIHNGGCTWCMGTGADWAYKCLRGFDKPPCMYDTTPEMVYSEIREYLDRIADKNE